MSVVGPLQQHCMSSRTHLVGVHCDRSGRGLLENVADTTLMFGLPLQSVWLLAFRLLSTHGSRVRLSEVRAIC